MSQIKSEYNSVCLSEKIGQIVKHLQLIDISFFQFVRAYKDGSITTLSNNDAWLELFLKEELYNMGFFSSNVFNLADGSYLWNSVPRGDVCAIAKTSFHIDHGLTILKKYETYANIYLFAANEANFYINNLYLNKLDLLFNFVNYFDSQIEELISKNDIKIITNRDISFFCDTIDQIKPENYDLFSTGIKRNGYFYLHNGKNIKLTPRQFDCVSLLLKGYPNKVIASQLSLSTRTCEHYIEAVKDKFDCHSRSDLISLLNMIQPQD